MVARNEPMVCYAVLASSSITANGDKAGIDNRKNEAVRCTVKAANEDGPAGSRRTE